MSLDTLFARNRYVYVAQLVLRGDETVELIATRKAELDRMLAALTPSDILDMRIIEGQEEALDIKAMQKQVRLNTGHVEEDDACPCPDCALERLTHALDLALTELPTKKSRAH